MDLKSHLSEPPTIKSNVILVGDSNVGTSAFVERLANNTFENKFVGSTVVIGQAFFEKNGLRSIVNVTAFPDNFDKSILTMFCQTIGKVNLLIVMFSFDSISSLNNVLLHITNMRNAIGETPVIVLGNKSDLANKSVTEQKITTAKSTWPESTTYIAVSALTGDNVRSTISSLI